MSIDEKALFPGIVLSIMKENIKIPQELKDFLSKDDQGIDGLDFMLRDAKLYKRIPTKVSHQYHSLYASIDVQLSEAIEDLRNALDKLEANPKNLIHDMIQGIYERDN